MHRRTAARPGQSLVEFGLILPFLSLLLLGAVDLGRIYYTRTTLANASRAAAAYATNVQIVQTLHGDSEAAATEAVRQVARAEAGAVPLSTVLVTTTWDPGAAYTVTVETNWTAVTPLISAFWGGGALPLRHATALRHNCRANLPCAYPPPPQCPAIAITGPTHTLTNLLAPTHTATITWTGSAAGPGWVEWSGAETGTAAAGSAATHGASFPFTAGGAYDYTVFVQNLCGQTFTASGSFSHPH